MNFLNSGFLFVLVPALALPLVIHLFNRRFPKKLYFPDLERIKKSLAERSKLMRWRHVLMTLLRTLAVLLALLAFLKPVLSKFGSGEHQGAGEGRRVLILLDRSLSMEHQEGAQASAARVALVEAGKIINTLLPGDRANAILVGSHPKTVLTQFTANFEELRIMLGAPGKSYEVGHVEKALALAASVLKDSEAGAEVYLVSDFQRSNWADAAFSQLPKGARLFFVNASEGKERPNAALLSADLAAAQYAAGEVVGIEVEAGNWSDASRTLPVEAVIDGQSSVAGEIKCREWSTGRCTLSFVAPTAEGVHTIEVKIPEDGLPGDDRRFLRFEVRQKEEILILSDGDAEDSGALFVATALDPFEDHGGPFAPRMLPVAGLTSGQISSTAKIVMTGARALSSEEATRLLAFVENGGGLLYFLNGTKDGENLEMLETLAARPVVPFKLAGRLTTENFGGQPQKIAKGEFRSPYLRLFRGENRQALSRLEFYEVYRSFASSEGQILLSFADGSPAMGVATIGLGTALFCNFAPAELTSNLARERSFPAWVQEMVKNLTPAALAQSGQEAGGVVSANLWMSDLNAGTIVAPDGKAVDMTANPEGDRVNVSFSAGVPGVYRLGRVWADVVNVSASESDLRAIDTAELTERAEEAPGGGGFFVSGADDFEKLSTGEPVAHWFLIALAAILFFEMLLHRRFHRPVA